MRVFVYVLALTFCFSVSAGTQAQELEKNSAEQAASQATSAPVPSDAEGAGSPATMPAVPPTADPAPNLSPAPVASLPHDLSPWGMFMQADIVVKAVMIGLAFASIVTWTVWLAKSLELLWARRRARRALASLVTSQSLSSAAALIHDQGRTKDAVAHLIDIAAREIARSPGLSAEGVKERVAIALSRGEAEAGRRIAIGTGVLATIGATAPFVGLFGTVWGIMNSFIGISQTKTTNLAIVAPGIAEALLATGIGLVAAIPAVIIYNVFARAIATYRALLSDASAEILQHLSRDLERDALAATGQHGRGVTHLRATVSPGE